MKKENKKHEKIQGSCIFKEESDASSHIGVSKEHLWSDWMDNFLPHGRANSSHSHIKTRITHPDPNFLDIRPVTSEHRGPMNTRKLRIVCIECNRGWMSDIEQDVKKILSELIQGKCTLITVDEQIFLSRWIVLKSIIGEYTDIPLKAIPESDRMHLKKLKSVPPNWNIWLGDFLGKDEGWRQKYSHTGAIMHRTDRPVPTVPNCQTTTFVLNELFMHASSMPEFMQDCWTPSPELVQIWPPSGKDIKWPPSLPLSDDAAGKIVYRLRNEMLTTSKANAAYFQIEPEYYNKLKNSTLNNSSDVIFI